MGTDVGADVCIIIHVHVLKARQSGVLVIVCLRVCIVRVLAKLDVNVSTSPLSLSAIGQANHSTSPILRQTEKTVVHKDRGCLAAAPLVIGRVICINYVISSLNV